MVFAKNLADVTFQDIEALQQNQISESDILDYKTGLIDDDSLIKHVSAFANTRGGLLIFGVTESGKGGYPTSIPGIAVSEVNKERMEQIILSNITPRLHVRIQAVNHRDNGKIVLLLQMPNSQYKPHYNNKTGKFHKRFEFEAIEMTEQEIAEAYRTRFYTVEQVEDYIRKLTHTKLANAVVLGNIIVIPSTIDRRLIDTSNDNEFAWLNPNSINPQPAGWAWAPNNDYVPEHPKPFALGICCEYEASGRIRRSLRIHRNGCVQYLEDFGFNDGSNKLTYILLALKLMHTLQFAHVVLTRYNYFGDVRIHVYLQATGGSTLAFPASLYFRRGHATGEDVIEIDREVSLLMLESDFSKVAASIMNEIFNHYGLWKCRLFDEEGNYKIEELSRE